MRYVKALEFPNGVSIHQAKEIHPGQYIRLFNSKKLSRWVGISRAGILVALHTNRSGRLLKIYRQTVKGSG